MKDPYQAIYDKLDWTPKPPEAPAPFDRLKLLKELALLAPGKVRKSPNTGVQASCQSCGWASGPEESRNELEETLEELGSHVVPGGLSLQASCPMCMLAGLTLETL